MLNRLIARARAWWHRREIRDTLDEEVQFHVEMESAANRARGLPPDDATRAALVDLGGTARVREAIIDVRTSRLAVAVDQLRQDVRYGLRTFTRAPLSIASVVLVLAAGIGLNSAIFGAINAIFFHSLSVPSPREVLYVTGAAGERIDFAIFRDRAHGAVEGVATTEPERVMISGSDLHVFVNGEWVGAGYFTTLRLRPEVGRFFTPIEDDARNLDRAVVVSDDLWRHRLGADPLVVGRHIAIDGSPYTIIGVAPRGFRGVSLPWSPSQFWATQAQRLGPGVQFKTSAALVARLAPGAAAADVRARVRDRAGQTSATPEATHYVVRPAVGLLAPEDRGTNFGFVRALADAVAVMALLVMLIAASNVVGILMARGVARSTELAIRSAVGAAGRRLVRQLLTESLLLGAAAGGAGLFVAWVLIRAYGAFSPAEIALDVRLDVRVLVYTLAVCVGAGLLVGIAPARQALGVDVLPNLGAPGAGTPKRARRRLRYASVIPQMALSVALLVVAGTHAQALMNVELRNPGFQIDNILTVQLSPPGRWQKSSETLPENTPLFFARVNDSLQAVPGVAAVASASALPSAAGAFPTHPWISRDSLERHELKVASSSGLVVSPGFFRTFNIPLVAGRDFNATTDLPGSTPVAIINATFARELAPDGGAIGLLITRYSPQSPDTAPEWLEVVGVVGDTREGLQVVPMVYTPTNELPVGSAWAPRMVIVRASTDPAAMAGKIKSVVEAIDPNALTTDIRTMAEVIGEAHYPRRLALSLLTIAGLLGVLLATIGLYSAVSYWVAQQARDLGVRATLGATRRDLIGLVMRDGAWTALVGMIPGLVLGFIGFRLTSGFVQFVIGPVAAPALSVISAVVLLVTIISLAASYVPGRRAALADPLVVLRS